ncbi:MAG: hypothetical protein ABIK44_06480 [candidate division WOR-3 bacterium]
MREEIIKREEEIRRLRPAYQKALEVVNNSKVLRELVQLLSSYRCGEPPEKAVYILGQCSVVMKEVAEAFRVVEDFEQRERSLEKLRESFPVIRGSETGKTGDFAPADLML